MNLHLIKLAVGADTIDDLQGWQNHLMQTYGKVFNTTRMVPKRLEELLDGGSLYWVIKRKIAVRQTILDIEPFTDNAGIKRCHIHLDPEMVRTRPQGRRPFQGWRYLQGSDAPSDLPKGVEVDADMPEALRAELTDLGLL